MNANIKVGRRQHRIGMMFGIGWRCADIGECLSLIDAGDSEEICRAVAILRQDCRYHANCFPSKVAHSLACSQSVPFLTSRPGCGMVKGRKPTMGVLDDNLQE
jgi:hypothetical protein